MTNLTTDDLKKLPDLQQTVTINNDTLFLVHYNGNDRKFKYIDLINRTENDLKDPSRNMNWNAGYLDGVPVNSTGHDDEKFLMYSDSDNAYVPVTIVPNMIDWSQNVTDSDFLRLDSNGDLESVKVFVSDIQPTNSGQANKFLRVSSDGTQIIEYDFQINNFLQEPSSGINDNNTVLSGLHRNDNSTSNNPENEIGYLVNLYSQGHESKAQLYLSSEQDKIRYRRSTDLSSPTTFTSWVTVYNDSENPLSDSVTLDSSTHIATSRAVKLVQDDLDSLSNLLTATYFLDQIKTVDGSGSGLDADLLDGLNGIDYASLFTNTPNSDIPIGAKRWNSSLNIFEEKTGSSTWNPLEINSDGVIDASLTVAGVTRYSTESESKAGTLGDIAVTPLGVKQYNDQFGIGLVSDGIFETDADDIKTGGLYGLESGSTGNAYSGHGSIMVIRTGFNDWVHQIGFEGDSNEISIRNFDGSDWSIWDKFFTTNNVTSYGQNILESNSIGDFSDVGTLGALLVSSETVSDAREHLEMSETDTVTFGGLNVGTDTVFHEGNLPTTDSRTDSSTTTVLQAKGMNDHRTSDDHDDRYYIKPEIDTFINDINTAIGDIGEALDEINGELP